MVMKAKHVKTGIRGETIVWDYLEAMGYDLFYPDTAFCGDIGVKDPLNGETYKVEVKTANRGIDGKYNFCLKKSGHTDCSHSDIVALVFMVKRKQPQIRFIKALEFGSMLNVKIASLPEKYKGKWSKVWTNTLC